MMFTIENWILFGTWILITIIISGIIIYYNATECEIVKGIVIGVLNLVVSFLVLAGYMAFIGWQHTSTASGIREMKDYQSELSNGIEREITIFAEDGREIFHYEGKIDIESNHTDNYIKFESEDGKRYIIYYGIQDTITIIEK